MRCLEGFVYQEICWTNSLFWGHKPGVQNWNLKIYFTGMIMMRRWVYLMVWLEWAPEEWIWFLTSCPQLFQRYHALLQHGVPKHSDTGYEDTTPPIHPFSLRQTKGVLVGPLPSVQSSILCRSKINVFTLWIDKNLLTPCDGVIFNVPSFVYLNWY